MLNIDSVQCGQTNVVRLAGSVGPAGAVDLRQHLLMLARDDVQRVVLNLHQAAYVSLGLLGMLAEWSRRLRHRGGALIVVGLGERCLPQLQRINGGDLVELAGSEDEALSRLHHPGELVEAHG